jgi:hypothetical protein
MTRYQAAVLFSMGYAAHYLAEEGLKHSEVGRLAKELKDLQRQERWEEGVLAAWFVVTLLVLPATASVSAVHWEFAPIPHMYAPPGGTHVKGTEGPAETGEVRGGGGTSRQSFPTIASVHTDCASHRRHHTGQTPGSCDDFRGWED